MLDHDHQPDDETADPNSPLFDGEGDIDEDRQDPPQPQKTDGDEPELDGNTATPGDGPEDGADQSA